MKNVIGASGKRRLLRVFPFVVDLPEGEPKMVMEKQRYAVGDILRGNCTSPPSNPPTNLTWIINGKKVEEREIYFFFHFNLWSSTYYSCDTLFIPGAS